MIVSASRRTDIPFYFSDWFEQRLREGYVDVANPFNARQIRRVDLSADAVDGFVFWTKYPQPMLDNVGLMKMFDRYPYYFNFTLTPYGADLEPGIPDKVSLVLDSFKGLADKIGPDRVVWRYDPVIMAGAGAGAGGAVGRVGGVGGASGTAPAGVALSTLGPSHLSIEYHMVAFEAWAERLRGYTHQVVISFFDDYARCRKAMKQKGLDLGVEDGVQMVLAEAFAKIAHQKGMKISSCSEPLDFSGFGIEKSRCVDFKRLEAIGNKAIAVKRNPNQRPDCGCSKSVDIGSYFTCKAGCVYCYACWRTHDG